MKASLTERPPSRQWRQLLNSACSGRDFLDPCWFSAWESSFLKTRGWYGPMRWLCAHDRDGLAGILPLATQKFFGLRFQAVAGYFMPFRDVPLRCASAESVAAAMVDACATDRGNVGLRIGPIEATSTTGTAFERALREAGWAVSVIHRGDLMYLDVPASRKDYESMLSGRARKADYFSRRLQRQGDSQIERYHGVRPDKCGQLVGELQHIESNSWVVRRGEPRFLGQRNERFWRALLADHIMGQALRIWMLYFEGEPASFCLTLDAGVVRYQLVNGYGHTVARHSTGHILFKRMVDDAIDVGIRRICFGLGDPGHKSEWGARPVDALIDIIALRPGMPGRLAASAYGTLASLRARLKVP